jgi:hypothetical protein
MEPGLELDEPDTDVCGDVGPDDSEALRAYLAKLEEAIAAFGPGDR